MFGINGLLYIPQYISQAEHHRLLETVDVQPWRTDLARRTQHYGYVYDYRARKVDPSAHLGNLPVWLHPIATQLCTDGLMPAAPDQAIVNEYTSGQGIADHIDCVPCFDDMIVSLSLAAPVVMQLKRQEEQVALLLEPCSLLLLRGEARYRWTHGIPRRRQDRVVDGVLHRQRRVSITFRKVILAS